MFRIPSRLVSLPSAIASSLLLAPLAGCGAAPDGTTGEGATAEQEALTLAASKAVSAGTVISAGGTFVTSTTTKVPPPVATVVSGGGTVIAPDTPPPPPQETWPSLVTLFSEPDAWGDVVNQQVVLPNSAAEAENTITFDMIDNAHLTSRISSVRIVCGARATQVTLFDFPNNGPLDHWWPSGKSFVLECAPFQTAIANLHQMAPELADHVGSAHILAHARNHKTQSLFSTVVVSNWVAQPLPEGASAPTGPVVQMTGSTSFQVTQDLVLTDTFCGDHDARLVLRVVMNQDRTFFVEVIHPDTRVSTGTGDTWGCQSGMQAVLDKTAQKTANKLAAKLPSLLLLAGTGPRVYFIPTQGTWVFDVGTGG